MTEEQDKLKSEIQAAKKDVRAALKILHALENQCTHLIEKGDYESAICSICGKNFGWWCPESKDHVCHYDDEGHDCCAFCGEPEERI